MPAHTSAIADKPITALPKCPISRTILSTARSSRPNNGIDLDISLRMSLALKRHAYLDRLAIR
ncbi:hypothetical protein SSBR45G_10880 [Bradyrhizobium sp. SSBR45G]|nr:hypothetical protein SSBR45G_10880 [Bradyrhizobium sp. SSBR45G]GLH83336.1 hypothetical protein SSBR45R_07960 [Bradyrhizobium sp. SSBR45R]